MEEGLRRFLHPLTGRKADGTQGILHVHEGSDLDRRIVQAVRDNPKEAHTPIQVEGQQWRLLSFNVVEGHEDLAALDYDVILE